MNQHSQTLKQVSAADLQSYLSWFRTPPLWLDLDGLRVVHACWDESMADQTCQADKTCQIRRTGQISGPITPITNEFLLSACRKNQPLFGPVETILKGKEAKLPAGLGFHDKDGHFRTSTRVRWYADPHGQTYRTYLMEAEPIDCDLPLEHSVLEAAAPYPATAKPVFIGHYWLTGDKPALLAPNVACLDWSVAKGGFLCAYRWNGEQTLDPAQFAHVPAMLERRKPASLPRGHAEIAASPWA